MGVWVCKLHTRGCTHYIIFILCSLNNSAQAIGPEINVSVRNALTLVYYISIHILYIETKKIR